MVSDSRLTLRQVSQNLNILTSEYRGPCAFMGWTGIISRLAGGFRLKVAVRPELGELAVIRGLLVFSAVRSFDFDLFL